MSVAQRRERAAFAAYERIAHAYFERCFASRAERRIASPWELFFSGWRSRDDHERHSLELHAAMWRDRGVRGYLLGLKRGYRLGRGE